MWQRKMYMVIVVVVATCHQFSIGLNVTEFGDDFSYEPAANALVECRTSYSGFYLNNLTCCVTNFTRLVHEQDCKNFTLSLAFESNRQSCKIDGPSCCSISHENLKSSVTNVTLVNNCNNEQAIQPFSRKFGENYSEPPQITSISVVPSKNGAVVHWNVDSCEFVSALQVIDLEALTTWKHYVLNDHNELESSCYEQRNMTHNLTGLQPGSNYELKLRQKHFKSPYWSKPIPYELKTFDDLPLEGPELMPGAVKFQQPITDCASFNEPWFNFTLIWKLLENNTISRGKISSYIIKVQYNDAKSPVPLKYDEEVLQRNYVQISINVHNVSTYDDWCSKPLMVEIWSKNGAGLSITPTSIEVQIDEVIANRNDLSIDMKNPKLLRFERLPDDSDSLVIYSWKNGVYLPTVYPIQGRGTTFDVGIETDLKLNQKDIVGASVGNYSAIKRAKRFVSTDFVEIDKGENRQTREPEGSSFIILLTLFIVTLVIIGVGFVFIALLRKKPRRRVVVPDDFPEPLPIEDDNYVTPASNQQKQYCDSKRRSSTSSVQSPAPPSSYVPDSNSSGHPLIPKNLATENLKTTTGKKLPWPIFYFSTKTHNASDDVVNEPERSDEIVTKEPANSTPSAYLSLSNTEN